MLFVCNSYVIRISVVCSRMSLVCHLYVTHINSYVIRMLLLCTRMLYVCHSYVRLRQPYVTRMYSYVTSKSLVCTRMSSVCHSYVVLPWNDFKKMFFEIAIILNILPWSCHNHAHNNSQMTLLLAKLHSKQPLWEVLWKWLLEI